MNGQVPHASRRLHRRNGVPRSGRAPLPLALVVAAAAISRGTPAVAQGASPGPPATTPVPRASASENTVAHDVSYYARAAEAAYRTGDTATYLRASRRTRDLAPSHPFALYALARAYALTGRPDSALALLARGAAMGDVRAVAQDRALAPLRADPRIAPALVRIAAAFAANARPVLRSRLAFTVRDPDLLPESLAYDAATETFFVGSLAKHKVVRVRPSAGAGRAARVTDFTGPVPDLPRVVGLKVDGPRRRLWFAAWAQAGDTATPLAAASPVDRSRLFAYDLRTGARLAAYVPPDAAQAHDLNDLVVTTTGDVYVTDTGSDAVYRVRAGGDRLDAFLRPDPARFHAPNGIALSGDGRRLYVAFVQGVAAVEIATRMVRYLDLPSDVTTAQVDGLAWYHGDLIAVQTIATMTRVVRFHLDPSGRRVTAAEVLERAHPWWRKPTTGVVVGDTFYYIPASGYDRLADDGALAPAAGTVATPFFRIDLTSRRR